MTAYAIFLDLCGYVLNHRSHVQQLGAVMKLWSEMGDFIKTPPIFSGCAVVVAVRVGIF